MKPINTWSSVFFLVIGAFICETFAAVIDEKTCYLKKDGPFDDPNNVYNCKTSETCCMERGKASCCIQKDNYVATMEQVKLWGMLSGMIAILAVFMFCCRHDGDFCFNRKDGGVHKYCCCGELVFREGRGLEDRMSPQYVKNTRRESMRDLELYISDSNDSDSDDEDLKA